MRYSVIRALLAPAICLGLLSPAAAVEFPTRNVRILVGFAPGGTTDLLARIIADELRAIWKTNVVVENRPGGDGKRIHDIKSVPVGNSPEDFRKVMQSDLELFRKVIADSK